MDVQKILQSSVREILQKYSEVIPVFIQLETQCIGCAFDRFCTLEDVANYYNIQMNDLAEILCEKISHTASREKE